MSFPHDRTSIGDFIAQHHDPFGTWGDEQGSRRRQGRCRFLGFDKTTGAATFDRIGVDHGGMCWLPTGSGNNLLIPVWSYALPGLIDASPQTQSGPSYGSKVQGPVVNAALKQLVDPSGKTWMADAGLLAQPGALPVGIDLPSGHPVLTVPMSTLDEQQMAIVPAGGLLVAVYNGGLPQGKYGTKVFDVDASGRLDMARWARLHSHFHVYLLPQQTPVGFIFGGNQFGGKISIGAPGGLAWMLAPDVDGQGGHGIVCDMPSLAGNPVIGETQPFAPGQGSEIIPGPEAYNAYLQLAAQFGQPFLTQKQFNQQRTTEVTPYGKAGQSATQEKMVGNGKPTKQDTGPAILAVSSYRGRGPFNVGQTSDPHQLSVTPDGKPVNALHEDEGTIVIGDTGDAPRKNDKNAWQPVRPDGPFANEAYRRNDLGDTHQFFNKTLPGLRKIQTTEYMDVPQPNGERPGTPGNPPPPPPPVFPGPLPGPEFPGPGGKGKKGGGFAGPIPPNPPGPGPDPPGGQTVEITDYRNDYGDGHITYHVTVRDANGNVIEEYDVYEPGPGVGPVNRGWVQGPKGPVPGGGAPGPGPNDGPVPPGNPGGATDAPPQKSFPAMGLALGVNDIFGRAASIQDNITDPRYQFAAYTQEERDIYDNTPIAVRLSTFQDQTGGGPNILGPKCGPSGVTTGITSHGGFAITPSGYDLPEKLRGIDQPLNPANRAYLNFETTQSFESFGDVGVNGLPANGYRSGRTYVPGGAKSMDIVETDSAGLEFETKALSLDFVNQQLLLWGVPVPMTGGGGGGTTDGVWGDGSDGAATLNGGGAPTGMTFDGSITYTLTRDVFYTDLTMSGVYRLETAGWRLFVNGTLTVGASNRISGDGQSAVNFTNGGATTKNTLGGGASGNVGVSRTTAGTTVGVNGINNTNSFGGAGGNGGASGTGPGGHAAGGTGGTVTRPATNFGELRTLPQIGLALLESYQGAVPLDAGAGGASGGVEFNAADAGSTYNSGGGGGGAGTVLVAAKKLVNSGIISAQGGAGGAATFTGTSIASGAGGGGGGGGGLVVVVYGSVGSTLGTLTVTGGGGGAATGSTGGTAGATGSTGRTRTLSLDTSGGGTVATETSAKLSLKTNQLITDNSDATISFQNTSALFDNKSGYNFATHPDRWTVPTGEDGRYEVSGGVLWGSNSQAGGRGCYVELISGADGTTTKDLIYMDGGTNPNVGQGTAYTCSGHVDAVAGDFFRLHVVLFGAGANVNAVASVNRTFMSLCKVGASSGGGGSTTLSGDVTGTTSASVVSTVGGTSAATVAANLPSANEKAAFAGTAGTPSGVNKFATDSDIRLSYAGSALQPGTATILTSTVAPSSTANVTLDASANIWPCNTASAFTATLPDATTCLGRHYWIKKTSADSNTLTIATTASQTIDGSLTISISVQWTTVHVVSDGTNWLII